MKIEELKFEMEEYAQKNNVPIIRDGGLEALIEILEDLKPTRVLEIGTAIGYSAIMINNHFNCEVVSIEYNEQMYYQAQVNVRKADKIEKIFLNYSDALEFDNNDIGEFDVIFVDAAKAKYLKYFNKFEINLADNGTFIFDNVMFHGLTGHSNNKDIIRTRRLRTMIRKLEQFIEVINNNENYSIKNVDKGDGLLIATHRR